MHFHVKTKKMWVKPGSKAVTRNGVRMIYEGPCLTYFPEISLHVLVKYSETLGGEIIWKKFIKRFSQAYISFNRNFLNMPKLKQEIKIELYHASKKWINSIKDKLDNAEFEYV